MSGLTVLAAVILVIRIVGLRSLSKMSSFDFAVTVAIGSMIASTTVSATPLANGVLGVVALMGAQAIVSVLRRRASFGKVVDNVPLLLMREGELLEAALDASRVTRTDVIAKLREANVLRLDQVRAVVLETTGDISVMQGDGPLDDILMNDIRVLG